jgi:undecaprenyl-diphosphatase
LSWLQIVVLAVVQGITEFLPISSSGHLILVPALTGWPDQGLAVDTAAHVGTLAAVLAYFWRDVLRMIVGFFRLIAGRRDTDGSLDRNGLLACYILAGTLPALAVGYVINQFFGDSLRSMELIAWTMIGFGIVLYLADRLGMTVRRIEHMRLSHALVIGCAQAIAFIPGTSRSGITMVAARLLGYERADAARFSFLLSIPAIMAGGILKGYELSKTGTAEAVHDALATAVLSGVAGLLAIAFLMSWLRRADFTLFVVYRLLLGAGLLYMVYVA